MWTRRAWPLLAVCLLPAGLLGWGIGCSPDPGSEAGSAVPAAAAPDAGLVGPDLFEDRTAGSGVDLAYQNGEAAGHLAILESLGGGAALIDYDRDGLADLYLPGGGGFGGPDNRRIDGRPGRLYRNLGGFRFQDATAEAGLGSPAGGRDWFYSHGAEVLDYDRDGWPDLLVTGWGRLALFRNEPGGRGGRHFRDVTGEAGLADGVRWATSAAAADLDGDGWPDLYVCQYVDWSFDNHPKCDYDGKTPDVCPPKNFSGLPHKVYRNTGQGRFEDVSDQAGLRKGGPASSKGLGVLAVDVNLDGKPDVYVANDTVDNFLYVNRSAPGRIRFTEGAGLAGVALDGYGNANGSMGVDAGDPAGTGKPALWVTNYEKELHALYKNESSEDGVLFMFASSASGIGAIGQNMVGWGTGFVDLDHDGWEDIVIVNGHAIRHPTGSTRQQKPVLLRNIGGGRFKDISPRGGDYFRKPHLGRGAALGDLDNDGRVDMVVSHLNAPAAVLRNAAPSAGTHWLGVSLARKGHADVVGARVVLEAGGRTQARFAKGGGSYLSAPDRRLVFGLGPTDRIDRLTVEWPGGGRQEWTGLAVGRYHVLTEGEPETKSK